MEARAATSSATAGRNVGLWRGSVGGGDAQKCTPVCCDVCCSCRFFSQLRPQVNHKYGAWAKSRLLKIRILAALQTLPTRVWSVKCGYAAYRYAVTGE